MSGYKTYLAAIGLIVLAVILGVLQVQGFVPAEVAVPVYGALIPVIGITIRLAIAQLQATQNASTAELNQKLDEISKQLEIGGRNDKQS